MAPMDSCSPNELNPPPDTLKVPVWVLLVHPGHLVYVFGKDDENLAKLHKEKAPKKRERKKTSGKDQSPSKQTAQKRWATRRQGNH